MTPAQAIEEFIASPEGSTLTDREKAELRKAATWAHGPAPMTMETVRLTLDVIRKCILL